MSTSSDNEPLSESVAVAKQTTGTVQEKGRKRGASSAIKDNHEAKVQRVDFSTPNRVQLLGNIRGQLPKRDTHSYKATIGKVDWGKVAFQPFTADQCQQQWDIIQADIRKFKNATEIVDEALGLVINPGYIPKLSALYPNMPKKPLTPFFQYYSEKNKAVKEKNPAFSQTKISQVLSEKYKSLPDKKKLKYVTRYSKGMQLYEEMKTRFYKEHPELVTQRKTEKARAPVCPTPYRLWLDKQLEGKPDVKRSEVETEMRAKWKVLSDKRRLKWIHMALDRRAEYARQIEDYAKKHGSFKPKTKPLLTKLEKGLYDTQQGKPTRPPMNGYSLFCSHFMKTKNGLSSTQKMQACSKEWKQLSERARNEYNLKTIEAKREYFANLEKYVATLPPEEAQKYEAELKSPGRTAAAKKKQKETTSIISGIEVYISEFKEKFAKKHPELKSNAIEKMLTGKYGALSTAKKDKYEEKAKEMNAMSSGSEAGSSSEEEHDDSDDDEDDVMARDLWIEHNLHSYMQVHKLKEPRARKSLQLAWENLEKPRKVPWKKQAQQNTNRMQQLLAKMPKKPHTSAYGIFTAEMMRNKDIVSLDHKSKMKAVAEKWKSATQKDKKRYEGKKDRLWKKYEKDVEKFKEKLSSQDQELLEKALANHVVKKSPKGSKESKEEDESSSEEEESESESDDEDGSSDESGAEETTAPAPAAAATMKKESADYDGDETSSSSESRDSDSEDEADQ